MERKRGSPEEGDAETEWPYGIWRKYIKFTVH